MAIIYADRLEAMIRSSPSYRPLKNDQSSTRLLLRTCLITFNF